MNCKNCDTELTEEEIQKRIDKHENKNYCDLCIVGYKYKIGAVNKYNKENEIHCGDNLEIMKYIEPNSIDLIYLDPPYFTQTNWKIGNNEFSDSWKDMDEYLNFMEDRLRQMYRILKDTGSIYLHVDHHAVYELKVIMDKIFGRENFINDIIWSYNTSGKSKRYFSHKHDTILFYSKTNNYVFNEQRVKDEGKNISRYNKVDEDGNKYYMRSGKYKVVYTGTIPLTDSWNDISALTNNANEKIGYPTQKPIELLERIIKASSNKDDIVLDPFCGSGSTLESAKRIGRKFIGIDQNKQAITMSKKRLKNVLTQRDFDDC